MGWSPRSTASTLLLIVLSSTFFGTKYRCASGPPRPRSFNIPNWIILNPCDSTYIGRALGLPPPTPTLAPAPTITQQPTIADIANHQLSQTDVGSLGPLHATSSEALGQSGGEFRIHRRQEFYSGGNPSSSAVCRRDRNRSDHHRCNYTRRLDCWADQSADLESGHSSKSPGGRAHSEQSPGDGRCAVPRWVGGRGRSLAGIHLQSRS